MKRPLLRAGLNLRYQAWTADDEGPAARPGPNSRLTGTRSGSRPAGASATGADKRQKAATGQAPGLRAS